MSLPIDRYQTNSNAPRSKLAVKTKRKKTIYANNSKQKRAKKTKKQRSNSRGARRKIKRHKRSTLSNKSTQKPTRSSASRQRPNEHLEVVEVAEKHPLTESHITTDSSTQATPEPVVMQYTFKKPDRAKSLMALQALAEKIATYRGKYGDIETRHSSIIAPPKARRMRKQRTS